MIFVHPPFTVVNLIVLIHEPATDDRWPTLWQRRHECLQGYGNSKPVFCSDC